MLKKGANVLLLDEPTNDLDVDTLRVLEDALLAFAGCAVIISHDRFFLDRIATHMLAFEGDSHVEWFEGNFADYEEDKKRRLGVDKLVPAPHEVQEVLALRSGRPSPARRERGPREAWWRGRGRAMRAPGSTVARKPARSAAP